MIRERDPPYRGDDLIRMKLVAGRTDDLRGVANLTSSEQGVPRRVFVSMTLASEVDHEWARDMAAERAAYFDPSSRVRITDSTHLQIEARRSDLTDRQVEQWGPRPNRSAAGGIITDSDIDAQRQTA